MAHCSLGAVIPKKVGTDQEVGATQHRGRAGLGEGLCLEHALVDHGGPTTQCITGELCGLCVACLRDFNYVKAFDAEALEDIPLMYFAPLDKLVEADIEGLRRLQQSSSP